MLTVWSTSIGDRIFPRTPQYTRAVVGNLCLRFDASKLKGSISGVADETKVEAVGTVLHDNSHFAERAELFRVTGGVTKKYSSKLEGVCATRKIGLKRLASSVRSCYCVRRPA